MNESPSPQPISSPGLLNEWLFDTIRPWLSGRVLEMGSTPNSISSIFVQKGRRLHLSNPDKAIQVQLRARYEDIETIRKVHSLNFHRHDFERAYPKENAQIFDTVLAFEALETGNYDPNVVSNARYILKQGGRLILVGPAFTASYDGRALSFEEIAQYDRTPIKKLLTDKMEVLVTKYFNLAIDSGYTRSGLSVITVARRN